MKKSIEVFDVDIDISDRDRLYDYATCRYITRKEGEAWRREDIRPYGGTAHVMPENENMMVQVRLMDKAINDTRCLQNTHDQEPPAGELDATSDPDTFETPLDLPQRVLPIYKPGEVVTGHVNLKLKEAIPAEALKLNFLGAGITNIRMYHQHGYHDKKRHEYYVNDTRTLWWKTGKKPEEGEMQTFSNLESSAPESGATLPAGTHRWPFEFTIPQITSQSTPNLHPSSAHYCYVMYRLKAEINAGSLLGRGNILTHKGLWVEKKYDIAFDPENLLPVTQEEVLDTGIICKSGKISIRATLPRKAFKKGENIPLELVIDNESSGRIDKVTAYIALHGKFPASVTCKTMSRRIDVQGAKKTMENVSSGMAPCQNWELPWDFSESSVDSNLMPTGTLDDCKLIEVKYDVVVKVKRPGLHRNMELQIPIYIGDYNSRE